jgi:hypothetical protein
MTLIGTDALRKRDSSRPVPAVRGEYETLNSSMAKWKQYELWVQTGDSKWEIVGQFPTTELATAVANARARRSRLIEVLYDGSKMLGQEIIAEIGNTRKE